MTFDWLWNLEILCHFHINRYLVGLCWLLFSLAVVGLGGFEAAGTAIGVLIAEV